MLTTILIELALKYRSYLGLPLWLAGVKGWVKRALDMGTFSATACPPFAVVFHLSPLKSRVELTVGSVLVYLCGSQLPISRVVLAELQKNHPGSLVKAQITFLFPLSFFPLGLG